MRCEEVRIVDMQVKWDTSRCLWRCSYREWLVVVVSVFWQSKWNYIEADSITFPLHSSYWFIPENCNESKTVIRYCCAARATASAAHHHTIAMHSVLWWNEKLLMKIQPFAFVMVKQLWRFFLNPILDWIKFIAWIGYGGGGRFPIRMFYKATPTTDRQQLVWHWCTTYRDVRLLLRYIDILDLLPESRMSLSAHRCVRGNEDISSSAVSYFFRSLSIGKFSASIRYRSIFSLYNYTSSKDWAARNEMLQVKFITWWDFKIFNQVTLKWSLVSFHSLITRFRSNYSRKFDEFHFYFSILISRE